jgi:predicted transcriptional regulator
MPFNAMVHCSTRGMRYRSRTEIVRRILEIANKGNHGALRTRIMYGAFLSLTQFKEYLRLLTDNDLLRYDGQTHTFKTTEKGLKFLEIFNQMSDVTKTQQQHHLW